MQKKVAIGLCLVLGIGLMATTALADGSSSNGFDIYKQAFNNTRSVNSLTANAAITISDNGHVLLNTNAQVKADRQSKNLSASVNLVSGQQAEQIQAYRQNGQTITKLSNNPVYDILAAQPGNAKGSQHWGPQQNSKLTGDMENVIDLLAGNFQNYISTGNAPNGDKEVSLAMSGNQVSPLANAVASLVVREGSLHMAQRQDPTCPVQAALLNQMPKLVDGIAIANIDLKADVTNTGLIKDQKASFTVTGKDAQGKTHQVILNVDLTFSDLNHTTPDSVNLSGKQVQTVQVKRPARFSNH